VTDRAGISQSPEQVLWRDSVKALALSRVWLFMGRQDLKRRFRGSFLGPLWILLHLLLFVGGVGLIYGLLFGQDLRMFLPFLTIGYVTWQLLVSSIVEAGSAFVVAEGYIKQFPFPKQVYILRMLVSSGVTFAMGLAIALLAQLALGVFNPLGWLLAVPGLVLLTIAVLLQIAIFAYLGAAFRDLPHALSGLILILFYVTPIVFPPTLLADHGLAIVYLVNPFFHLIEIVRHPMTSNSFAEWPSYLLALAYLVALLLIGSFVALRLDRRVVFLL
jgi:lipopolysaccharide transport system permease protein